ncbi:hybrid sensor histidine kinase/response regulator [Devosia sp.]|uniref:hybrid sensor histidine kinase/response regulator n=1 Tax=Devosia sp. TaxID=1871048 RepID=UPI002FC994A6
MTEIPVLTGESMSIPLEVPGGERACVLVVDDNPGKVLSLTAIISGMPLEVVTAASGRAALRWLLERDFALILLDVNMPAMDGYETAHLIHGRPRSAHTPIIFITAEAATDNDQFRGYTAGAVDWVFSPIIPEILRAKVQVFIDLYHLTRMAQLQTEQLRQRAIDIERKNTQLEEVSRLKSSFLASMSHELRTPLNAIIGFAAVLQDGFLGELPPKQKEAVRHVRDAGNHLLALVNDILDISKIEAGKMVLHPEPCYLPQTLEDALTLVRSEATRKRLELCLEVAPEVGLIEADPAKLKQILYNLLSNAIKFTPEAGRVTVRGRRVGTLVEVAVADTGIGVRPGDQERIFGEFEQVDSAYARQVEGTGLGLPLTRRLVELHRGTLTLESAEGKGSTFTFTLPLRIPLPARA